MGVVEWLAVVATPFLFASVLYLLKEQKENLIEKINVNSSDLRRLQSEIYDYSVEAKKLNEKVMNDIHQTKSLVKDLYLAHSKEHSEISEKFTFEIVKISQAAAQIENYSESLGKLDRAIADLHGKIILIENENIKQNRVLRILIEKIKKET